MPVTQITLLPGYPDEARERLVKNVSLAVASVIDASPAGITTYVSEAATYQRDGAVRRQGGGSLPNASDLALAYLQAMEAGRLDEANTHLGPGFIMQFPGKWTMTSLDEFVQRSRARYQFVGKHFERFDECWAGDVTIVYCFGTLHGRWLSGESFEGIRFIDRFEFRKGKITRQDVWNDIGEVRMAAAQVQAQVAAPANTRGCTP